jgi:NAD(P)-dependent dehydrogenase (short-subunit alcohol dehydrogenase family)
MAMSFSKLCIKHGVRVNGVAPGPVWTPLIPATMPLKEVQSFGATSLFKRPAQPVEQAAVYVFLASGDASYVTGEIYGATGGKMRRCHSKGENYCNGPDRLIASASETSRKELEVID